MRTIYVIVEQTGDPPDIPIEAYNDIVDAQAREHALDLAAVAAEPISWRRKRYFITEVPLK